MPDSDDECGVVVDELCDADRSVRDRRPDVDDASKLSVLRPPWLGRGGGVASSLAVDAPPPSDRRSFPLALRAKSRHPPDRPASGVAQSSNDGRSCSSLNDADRMTNAPGGRSLGSGGNGVVGVCGAVRGRPPLRLDRGADSSEPGEGVTAAMCGRRSGVAGKTKLGGGERGGGETGPVFARGRDVDGTGGRRIATSGRSRSNAVCDGRRGRRGGMVVGSGGLTLDERGLCGTTGGGVSIGADDAIDQFDPDVLVDSDRSCGDASDSADGDDERVVVSMLGRGGGAATLGLDCDRIMLCRRCADPRGSR